jgi:hypothetical protein
VNVDLDAWADLDAVSNVVIYPAREQHLRVAPTEATGLELVGHQRHAGGLDNVATVLAELADSLSSSVLDKHAILAPLAWAQRPGNSLELVDQGDVAGQLLALESGFAKMRMMGR